MPLLELEIIPLQVHVMRPYRHPTTDNEDVTVDQGSRAHGGVAVVFCVAFLNWCCFQGWIYWVV
ncbi:hypothetical protein BDP27DRAFT_1397461, partial [Rhodocollybia butyracea]